jgi:hypothetical protein
LLLNILMNQQVTEYSQEPLLVSQEQIDEFRGSATELAAINLPSVGAGIYSELAFGHSAQVSAAALMEVSDVVFSVGTFFTEKLDRIGNNKLALRIRQMFALGHIATASAGVAFGINDIISDNIPPSESMVVAGTIAGASAISLMRDKAREKKRQIATLHEESEAQSNHRAFHGLNAEFVKDMKLTNIAEAGGGILAVLAQQYNDNGSAALTITSSAIVVGIMAKNAIRQQRVHSSIKVTSASKLEQ